MYRKIYARIFTGCTLKPQEIENGRDNTYVRQIAERLDLEIHEAKLSDTLTAAQIASVIDSGITLEEALRLGLGEPGTMD